MTKHSITKSDYKKIKQKYLNLKHELEGGSSDINSSKFKTRRIISEYDFLINEIKRYCREGNTVDKNAKADSDTKLNWIFNVLGRDRLLQYKLPKTICDPTTKVQDICNDLLSHTLGILVKEKALQLTLMNLLNKSDVVEINIQQYIDYAFDSGHIYTDKYAVNNDGFIDKSTVLSLIENFEAQQQDDLKRLEYYIKTAKHDYKLVKDSISQDSVSSNQLKSRKGKVCRSICIQNKSFTGRTSCECKIDPYKSGLFSVSEWDKCPEGSCTYI